MLKNYIKTAFRNLWREKTYSLINIIGLSVGLASCFIILLYSVHELSYDRYNKKLNRIYLVTMDWLMKAQGWTQPLVPFPAGPALKAEYPEVQEYARCNSRTCQVKYGTRTFDAVRCVSADSTIFKILTLPIVEGNLKETFEQRNYAVISRSLARRLFGNGDAIGQVIDVNWSGQRYNFTVSAIMKDIPSTSTFQADCILPIFAAENSIMKQYSTLPDVLHRWWPPEVNTYLLLSTGNSAVQLRKNLVKFSDEHASFPTFPHGFHLVALKDMYFRPATIINTFLIPRGNLSDVEIYSAIALLILMIACINFVMLSTARATARTKEIGVRKVIGASRLDVVKQTMIESLLVAVISLPVALLLVELFMPSLTTLLGKKLPADYYRSAQSIVLYIAVTLVAGILSGSYVSFYLSRFHPAEILRNKFDRGHDRITLRRFLLGFQMVIFVGLILSSITIYRQMRYFHTKNMGFNDKDLVVFSRFSSDDADTILGDRYQILASKVEMLPNVLSVACGDRVPGTEYAHEGAQGTNLSRPQEIFMYDIYWVSRDFFKAMGMKMVYGKTFEQASPEESKDAVILNQEAVKDFGITNPSEQLVEGHRILGVVKDFNAHSLRTKILPAMFYEGSKHMQEIAVRLNHMHGAQGTIASIEKEIEKLDGDKRFRYQFFSDRLSAMYKSDYKFADMIGYFTALAIFIACLGLFGMSLFVIQRRVKEIGVRKVLGASVTNILLTTVREFLILLFILTALSLPISFYFIDKWLSEYAYHINISVISVLLALLAGLVIVLLTISYQTLKAATANPVESLRYE